ncbi:MAG: hypothetical protein K2L02_02800 [Clostridia bacterium]|nr:hypothetical protein [Clostridia bacterium]
MNESEGKDVRKQKKPIHAGHRQRILERFETDGERFQDHEILEILLFNAIPRSNTNPLAHALIDAFGSLAAVFRASVKELMLVDGVGKRTAEYLRCIGLCYDRTNPVPQNMPLFNNSKEFGDFLEEAYRNKTKEILEIYCLDKLGRVQFKKAFSIGKSDEVRVDSKEFAELLVVKKPHTVVVAHNHPHGLRNPSEEDDIFTKQFLILCRVHNVKLGDHIVVGRDGAFSYRSTGRLEKIKQSCVDIPFGEGSSV